MEKFGIKFSNRQFKRAFRRGKGGFITLFEHYWQILFYHGIYLPTTRAQEVKKAPNRSIGSITQTHPWTQFWSQWVIVSPCHKKTTALSTPFTCSTALSPKPHTIELLPFKNENISSGWLWQAKPFGVFYSPLLRENNFIISLHCLICVLLFRGAG